MVGRSSCASVFLLLSAAPCAVAYGPQLAHVARRGARPPSRVRIPLLQETETKKTAPFGFLGNAVPKDQQPLVEMQQMKRQPFFSWAEDDDKYKARLFSLY